MAVPLTWCCCSASAAQQERAQRALHVFCMCDHCIDAPEVFVWCLRTFTWTSRVAKSSLWKAPISRLKELYQCLVAIVPLVPCFPF